MKAEPRRMCIGCRQVWARRRLIRLMRLPDGQARVDASGRGGGRGAYVCPTAHCLGSALKRGKLAHALRGPVAVGEEVLVLFRARAECRTGEPELPPEKGKAVRWPDA